MNNMKTGKTMETDYDVISESGKMLVKGTRLLLLSSHTREFIDEQKKIISGLKYIDDEIRNECLSILDKVEIKGGVI